MAAALLRTYGVPQIRQAGDLKVGLWAPGDALDLDAIQPAGRRDGDLSRPRRYEVAAALNRLRTAKFEAASAKRGRDGGRLP
mgnify:CR=1 FL=1